MRLATIRTAAGSAAVRIVGDHAIELGHRDVGELLRHPGWRDRAGRSDEPRHQLSDVEFVAVVPAASKIFCVGLNYRTHILETGHGLPRHPTLFAKFADTLLGARDDIVLPAVSDQVDWEVELGVVVGAPVRRADPVRAGAAIAGYTVVNDVSMRDWQGRTSQWLQGKAFEASTPVGPWLVTPDEVDATDLELRCEVDGEAMQRASTSDLLFTPAEIVAYISQFTTLRPGDLIATGTPGGVGAARVPPVFLRPGQLVRAAVDGIGECLNRCVPEPAALPMVVGEHQAGQRDPA